MKACCAAFVLALCLAACDPARRIEMINQTGGEAEFLWIIREDSIPRSPFFISNSDSLSIRLGAKKPLNEAKMSLGQGPWSGAELTSLVGGLQALEIHAASVTIKLEDPQALKTFLAIRRRGWDGSKIRIVLKEPAPSQ